MTMQTKINFLGSPTEIPKKIEGWNHTFQLAKPYVKENGIGVDVGCREGGFAREMEKDFTHIHCFDFRDKKKMFEKNVSRHEQIYLPCLRYRSRKKEQHLQQAIK